MNTPHFITDPPTETELTTAHCICKDMNMPAVAKARNLSREAIKTHTKALRFKFHATTITGAVCNMIGLGYLPADGLKHHLPAHWHQYIKTYQAPGAQGQNAAH